MRGIAADHRPPGPTPPSGPEARLAASRSAAEARFYVGLVAVVALLVATTLALIALVPSLLPGWRSIGIVSGSMSPGIRPGDVIVVADHDGNGLGPGTVIVFGDPSASGLVTHRIVAVNQDGSYTTQGDANNAPDPHPVTATEIVGVGRLLVPYVGLPRVWLQGGNWHFLILLVAAAAVAIWYAQYAIDPRHDPWRRSGDARQATGETATPDPPAAPPRHLGSTPLPGRAVHPSSGEEPS